MATFTEENKTVKFVAAVARTPGKSGADSILQMEIPPELVNGIYQVILVPYDC